MANPAPDPMPPPLSVLRRQLISATAPEPADAGAVDFEAVDDSAFLRDLARASRPTPPPGYDEVEALLHRYQAEKGLSQDGESRPASSNGARRAGLPELRGPGRAGLPPLTTSANAELERLRAENLELRGLAQEYRDLLEANDPTVWEQKVAEAQQLLTERTEELDSTRKQLEEWNEKFKTHRFVARDEELAREADELDKERSQLAQDRKQIHDDRAQLKEDEETLMKQMRDMEMSMAKDRAEIARQRVDLQRMQAEIKHETELLQRGDATVKERLAAFQRRPQDSVRTSTAALAPVPPTDDVPRPRDSSVFKKLFGQGR